MLLSAHTAFLNWLAYDCFWFPINQINAFCLSISIYSINNQQYGSWSAGFVTVYKCEYKNQNKSSHCYR